MFSCCIPLRHLHYQRENINVRGLYQSAKKKPQCLPQISQIYVDEPPRNISSADLHRHQSTSPNAFKLSLTPILARAHRVFQKYQCRSVYTLTISMLHLQSELIKCHHSVICIYVMKAKKHLEEYVEKTHHFII